MKTLIALVAVIGAVSLTGCATSSQQDAGSVAYTTPKPYNYEANSPGWLTTSNSGSLFSPNDSSEDNDL